MLCLRMMTFFYNMQNVACLIFCAQVRALLFLTGSMLLEQLEWNKVL